MYSTPSCSKSHLVAASTPGYWVETRQLRNSSTRPVMGAMSGVVVGTLRSLYGNESTRGNSMGRRSHCSRSEEHTSELQSLRHLVSRLLPGKNHKNNHPTARPTSSTHQPLPRPTGHHV